MTEERTVEQLNQTELSQAAEKFLTESGVQPVATYLYLEQFLKILVIMWESSLMQWEKDCIVKSEMVYGWKMNDLMSGTLTEIPPEWQYRTMTDSLEQEYYLTSEIKKATKYLASKPEANEKVFLWEFQDLLDALTNPTADYLTMDQWKKWRAEEMEEEATR